MLIHERFLSRRVPSRRAHVWEWFAILLTVASFSHGHKSASPIRIATTTWLGAAFIHLAHSLGYFNDEGVAVRLIEHFTVGDARRAFEHGQADVAHRVLRQTGMLDRPIRKMNGMSNVPNRGAMP